ncbi:hypothetical protein N7468_009103 [Penicillium chermesinum]|uniref:Uncharacterized protein n=1 Tax=Penicillium chermesinum TaxID=63820 RepID=A0A9W9NH54_9EURO|nr:uncharacterized protein N7468_009103 [Penicillium chermesinum]KAJ5219899.1 hypothetical protein N7468_009103 [Penicillium chermesinum]
MRDLRASARANGGKTLREVQWRRSLELVNRLTQNPDRRDAHAVHEIDIADFDERGGGFCRNIGPRGWACGAGESSTKFKTFPVRRAPAINAIVAHQKIDRLHSSEPSFEAVIRAVNEHPNKPELHLLQEGGLRVAAGPLPCVRTIHARVNPFCDTAEQPNRRVPRFQQMFFACPNLRSFSFTLLQGPLGPNWFNAVNSFVLRGEEQFPPLELLSLDDFRIRSGDWMHWRENADWSILRSLSLGPHWDVRFLTGLTGHANALAVSRSFSTLEKLTIKGRLVSVETLSSHPRLKQLCVHMFELPRGRDVLVRCPHLEVLKIDVNHPIAMLAEATKPLAIGFDNLRHLTLHLEVGLTWPFPPWRARITDIKPLHPELNETMAKEFGQAFFAWRPESKLQTLSLKTGEKRPPSRIVRNAQEEAAARTAHMCRSASRNGKLVVKVERRCPSEKD